jgi:pyruvate dehydrogenase E2 component (dihydrolipoamide acetyltransferase)
MATVIRMPQLAAGGDAAAIQSWLVSAGDEVAVGQPLAEIETEKAVVEYESEVDGVFAGSVVAAGDAAPVGAPIAVIAGRGEPLDAALAAAGVARVPSRASLAPPAPLAPEPAAAATARPERIFASPLVRRLAAERGVDLSGIAGSGPNGRIVRRDLDDHVAASATPSAPVAEPSARDVGAPTAGPGYTDMPHTAMRRAIARRLTESVTTVPHFFMTADCRVDELLAVRARVNDSRDPKISLNDFVVKAVAAALRDVPEANAVWTEDATRRFDGIDIAIAVSVPSGLVTPVVRGVERLSLGALSDTIRDLTGRAREGRLKQSELEGGSFSVSNLGMYGTQAFMAIINPPHSGILAVGAAQQRPVVDADGALSVATVMTVTLSADHRVLDGALAAQWLAAFVRHMENPLSILV